MTIINKLILKTPWLTANLLTTIRLLSSFPLFIFVVRGWYWAAFFLFSFMSLTDILDGHIARLKKTNKETGAIFDGLTDMFFFLPSFTFLGLKFLNPTIVFLLVALEISRGVLALLAKILQFKIILSSNIAGKIKAWFEYLGLMALLLSPAYLYYFANIFFIIAFIFAIANLVFHLERFARSNINN